MTVTIRQRGALSVVGTEAAIGANELLPDVIGGPAAAASGTGLLLVSFRQVGC